VAFGWKGGWLLGKLRWVLPFFSRMPFGSAQRNYNSQEKKLNQAMMSALFFAQTFSFSVTALILNGREMPTSVFILLFVTLEAWLWAVNIYVLSIFGVHILNFFCCRWRK
jgi:hypothetical protein